MDTFIKQRLNRPADIFAARQKYPMVFFCYLVASTMMVAAFLLCKRA